MPLCSAVPQRMANSGVLSTQEAPKSLPEIELGGKRRKEDVKRTWIRVLGCGAVLLIIPGSQLRYGSFLALLRDHSQLGPAGLDIEDIGGGLSLEEEALLWFDLNERASCPLGREVCVGVKILHLSRFAQRLPAC